jgi:hypothetical protein
LPVFGVNALGPVQILDVLGGADERAIGAVEHIEEAVAGKMAQRLARLAIDRNVVEHL